MSQASVQLLALPRGFNESVVNHLTRPHVHGHQPYLNPLHLRRDAANVTATAIALALAQGKRDGERLSFRGTRRGILLVQ